MLTVIVSVKRQAKLPDLSRSSGTRLNSTDAASGVRLLSGNKTRSTHRRQSILPPPWSGLLEVSQVGYGF
jgi:hypothetical protein